MSRAVLSLGSNLGDRQDHLAKAVAALDPYLIRVSSVYRTPPWGPVPQEDFYNIAALVQSPDIDATGWLSVAHTLERAADRVRDVRWGPRTLDVDVISVDDVVSADPDLTLPHPRAHERAFVLLPWYEIEPTAELAGHGPIAALLTEIGADDISVVGHVG